MKKIAIIVEDYTLMGGTERVTANLCKLFLSNNVPLWGLISLKKTHEKPKLIYPSQLHIEAIPIKLLSKKLIEEEITDVILQMYDLNNNYKILKNIIDLKVKKYSVLHTTPYAHLHRFLPATTIRGQLSKLKVKVFTRPKNLALLKNIALMSDKYIMVSKSVENEIKILLPSHYHSKITYIYNSTGITETSNTFKKNIITYAGRLTNEKRVTFLVKTLIPILQKNYNWEFHILGDGPEFDTINEILCKHNISTIKILGSVEDVHQRLSQSKICILYSYYEGLPTVLLEGAYTHNVLLSYNSKGGVKDIVHDGVNGFIVDNEQELQSRVKYLIDNEHEIERLSDNNTKVLESFSDESILDRWEKILSGVI